MTPTGPVWHETCVARRHMNSDSSVGSRRQFLGTLGLAALAAGAGPLAPPDKQPPDLQLPAPPSKKVGFAIVGLGELALEQIMPAFAPSEKASPVALVSGHRDKAEKVAAHYGINPKAIYDYQNYDSLRDNPDVQVIYIVLPNSMHAEYTVRGFAAGKHVLCEKPMADTPDECRQMIAAGKKAGKKLMIAYRLHYEPYNQAVIELMRKKALGPIRMFSAENLQTVKAPNIRLSTSTGGGPLGDVGIYCLNAARYVTGEEPVEVFGQSWADPNDDRFREVPSHLVFTLRFPSGAMAHCSAGFDSSRTDAYRVTCADGSLELQPAFEYVGQRLSQKVERDADVKEIGLPASAVSQNEIVLPHANHFAREMDHFADCVLNDKTPLTAGEEGLTDITILTAIKQSMAEGRAIKL
jgi:predicted dehydrogenase